MRFKKTDFAANILKAFQTSKKNDGLPQFIFAGANGWIHDGYPPVNQGYAKITPAKCEIYEFDPVSGDHKFINEKAIN